MGQRGMMMEEAEGLCFTVCLSGCERPARRPARLGVTWQVEVCVRL